MARLSCVFPAGFQFWERQWTANQGCWKQLCPVLSCLCHSLRVSRCTPPWLSKVSLWCQWDITSWLLVALTSGAFPGSAAPAAWTDTNAESHCLELWQCVT